MLADYIFKMCNPSEIYKETTSLLQQTAGYNNFVVSSGCDTPPGVPKENNEDFFSAVKTINHDYKNF
jgi:uroporphyrinogen decarboxylase